MSSVVHYRFQAGSSDWSVVRFEGSSLSVCELQTHIIGAKRLNAESAEAKTLNDFTLIFTNAQTGEEYHGNTFIPKNSSIIVRRIPANRAKTLRVEADAIEERVPSSVVSPSPAPAPAPAPSTPLPAANANRSNKRGDEFGEDIWAIQTTHTNTSVSGAASHPASSAGVAIDKTIASRPDATSTSSTLPPSRVDVVAKNLIVSSNDRAPSSAASVAAPHSASSDTTITHAPHQHSQSTPIIPSATLPNKKPPPGYRCYNCGSSDHYILHCPNALRRGHKRTVMQMEPGSDRAGAHATRNVLPRSTLHDSTQHSRVAASVQVVASTNSVAPSATATATSTSTSHRSQDLLCPLCGQFFNNAVVVPCCFSSFCDECIRQAVLSDGAHRCPVCKQEQLHVQQLNPNTRLQRRVDEARKNR